MGKYKVTTQQGTFLVTTEDVAGLPSQNKEARELYNPENYLSKSVFMRPVPESFSAEDVLPYVGGAAGAVLGAPVPIPFSAAGGAVVGGQVGETARQYVRAVRGKPVAKTPSEALLGTGIAGLKQGAYELGGAAIVRGLRGITAKGTFETGFENYLKKVGESFGGEKALSSSAAAIKNQIEEKIAKYRKADNAIYDALDKKIGDALASNDSSTKEIIEDILKQRDIQYNPGVEVLRQRLLQADRMSPQEILDINQQLTTQLYDPLTSKLKFISTKEYRPFASLLDDLSKENLTFKDLKRIRTAVGDKMGIDSPLPTSTERLYRRIYNGLSEDMLKTAEESGVVGGKELAKKAANTHKTLKNFEESPIVEKLRSGNAKDLHSVINEKIDPSGFKTLVDNGIDRTNLQQAFMNDLIGSSRTFGEKTVIKPRDVSSYLSNYSDEQLNHLFGKNSNFIFGLRDLAGYGSEKLSGSAIRDVGLSPQYLIKPQASFSRLGAPGAVKTILNRNLEGLSPEEIISNIETVYPQREGLKRTISNVGRGIGGYINSQ